MTRIQVTINRDIFVEVINRVKNLLLYRKGDGYMKNMTTDEIMKSIRDIDELLEDTRKQYVVYEGRSYESMTAAEKYIVTTLTNVVYELTKAKVDLQNELLDRGIFIMQ